MIPSPKMLDQIASDFCNTVAPTGVDVVVVLNIPGKTTVSFSVPNIGPIGALGLLEIAKDFIMSQAKKVDRK